MDASGVDDESIVGDECHIIAQHINGPRGDSSVPENKRDEYANLILLCKTHHKMIDDQPNTYTVDVLRKMKSNHERWVKNTLRSPSKSAQRLIKLPRIKSGKDVVALGTNAHAFNHHYDLAKTPEEVELVSNFFSDFQDLDILEPPELVKVDSTFDQYLQDLQETGYFVYGVLTKGKLQTQMGIIDDWKVAFIVLSRRNQEAVLIEHKA